MLVGVALGVTLTLVLTDRDPGHTATAIVTAAAALGVALLTVVTTDRRQDKQLAHEAERQREELTAERARQAATLRHERQMRARDEQIELIEQGAAALAGIRRGLDSMHGSWERGIEYRADAVREAVAVTRRSLIDGRSALARLGLRFGDDSALVDPFKEASKAHSELTLITLRDYEDGVAWSRVEATMQKLSSEARAAEDSFLKAAHRALIRLDAAE